MRRLPVVTAIVLALAAMAPAAASAQQSGTAGARPAAKPANAAKPAARRPALADDARATTSTARPSERPIPREQPTALGRLTLPSGSIGYESRTQIQAYDMSDGRRVPGYENIQRNDSSYFGLSLRMPTTDSPGSMFSRHRVD